jgi:hypothetical protein
LILPRWYRWDYLKVVPPPLSLRGWVTFELPAYRAGGVPTLAGADFLEKPLDRLFLTAFEAPGSPAVCKVQLSGG